MIRFLPMIAMVSVLGASVEAGLPVDPGTIDALGKWPLTVVLGAVCVIAIYFMYRQSKESAERIVSMAESERQANALRSESYSKATRELGERNAVAVKELTENHTKEVKMLLDEFVKQISKGKQ